MDITLDRTGVEPGAPIEGTVRHTDADEVILELSWETKGHGDRDDTIVVTEALAMTGRTQKFSITAPLEPITFSGKLISVLYKLRARAGADQAEVEIVIAPGGTEVRLAGA